MAKITSLRHQVQRNLVAIISLAIAVTSLSYNTWRNEQTEYNRNQRIAAMEVLLKLGAIQELVFFSHYEGDKEDRGNPRSGWALVLTVRDLSQVLEDPLPEEAGDLVATWADHWEGLGANQASADAILEGVDEVRDEAVALLLNLD